MTEHVKPNNGGGFEREDLGTRPIFGFLVSLVVTGVLVYYVLWGMFHFMDAYDRKHQHTKSPMVQAEQDTREPNSEKTYEKIKQQFSEPRLEDDERTELNDSRYQQDETLSSYGWVDQSGGDVRILRFQFTLIHGPPGRVIALTHGVVVSVITLLNASIVP